MSFHGKMERKSHLVEEAKAEKEKISNI